jgi:hypothetical protein
MGPPSAKQINVHDSLDERWACKNFLGKNVEQAELLFRENALRYQEALMWMGPVAFRYYVPAFVRYIQSEFAKGDSDSINCLHSLLSFKSEHDPKHLAPCSEDLVTACRYVIDNYGKFAPAPEIYGDLRGKYQSLVATLQRLKAK